MGNLPGVKMINSKFFPRNATCQEEEGSVYNEDEEIVAHVQQGQALNRKEAMVFSASKGDVVVKLIRQHSVAAVQGEAVTNDYFLVIFNCAPSEGRRFQLSHASTKPSGFWYLHPMMPGSGSKSKFCITPLLSEGSAGLPLLYTEGCCNDFTFTCVINHLGYHLVALSRIPDTNTTEIILWNLKTTGMWPSYLQFVLEVFVLNFLV
ncbi:uncharacterized protein LOC127015559 [Gymnogyps californianus]|uniref:uncharacterized protein LOC127015559 n=1 Tax=Gymnogyps californianus TaxID=33616 RepID=UPI0021C667C5|nr:uncharacterized protein LOC127015559 [Gymnogyps californianus]